MKKYNVIMVVMGALILGACGSEDDYVVNEDYPAYTNEAETEPLEDESEVVEDEVTDEPVAVASQLELVRTTNNQLALMDLATGQETASFDVLPEEILGNQIWALANGQFAVLVEENPFADLLGIEIEEEVDTRFVVLDANLNVVEEIPFDGNQDLAGGGRLSAHFGSVRLNGGELYLYGNTTLPQGVDSGEIVKKNLLTGAVVTVFAHNMETNFTVAGFLDENTLVVWGNTGMGLDSVTHFGLANMETGVLQLLEHSFPDGFGSTFTGTHLIFRADSFSGGDEVAVLNLQTLELAVIVLGPDETPWAQLTSDGRLITVSLIDEAIRMYDFDGVLMAEATFVSGMPAQVSEVEIYELGDGKFAVHLKEPMRQRQVEVVSLEN